MKKIICLIVLLPLFFFASAATLALDKPGNDLSDKSSLKRGFKSYLTYCLACHQLAYQRYNRTFTDLDIDEKEGKLSWMPTGEKTSNHIINNLPAKDAAKWFGSTPPDLTLVTRFRSPEYIYTYLRTFYIDENRPFGVNNAVFPEVGMPHVLQNLQGIRTMDYHGELSEATGGSMTTEEYDSFVRDLVNFLEYVGEPNKLERKSLGYWVLGFLLVLFTLTYLLKKEYWKDIY